MLIICLLVLFTLSPLDNHNIHLSVTNVEIGEDQINLEFKIFYDDLQKSMDLESGGFLPENYKSSDDLINQFIEKNFQLFINSKPVSLNYIETSAALPAIWASFKADKTETLQKIEIRNTILISEFEDQKNLLKIEGAEFKEEFIFTIRDTIKYIQL